MSKHLRVLTSLACISLLAFAVSCASTGGDNNCNDGIDNDGDGLIDSEDPGCELNGDLEAPDPDFPECSDRVDNDGDGDIDFPDDQGCDTPDDNREYNDPVPACQDGIDNDGDGLIDYPHDPGCFVSLDNDEEDGCPGVQCPKCANGVDDDDDGFTDYPDDPGCDRASDDDEFNADPTICGANVTLLPLPSDGLAMGTVAAGGTNELISSDCGGGGNETVYTLNVTEPRTLVVSTDFTETTVDTVLYIRSDCRMSDTELGCNDDTNGGTSSTLSVDVQPGVYYIVVDAHDSSSAGDYKLQVDQYLPEGAECDPAMSECAPGLLCRKLLPTSTTETCEKPACNDGEDNDGDGLTDYPNEPGCTDADDNDETDTCPGAGCPACSNDTDDDSDGLTDYDGGDPGCTSAADDNEIDECIPGVEVMPLTPGGVSGTTSGAGNFVGSCDSFSNQPEDVYSYKLDRNLESITFTTEGSTLDTVTYVRLDQCDNSSAEIACEDPGSGGEAVTLASPAQGTYFVFVDGDFSTGSYVLDVNGIIPAGEACDPADTNFVCTAGYYCNVNICDPAPCNDGVDNDSDGLMDWPNDPGCSSISDADETDDCPSGPNCPACSNGMDDDGDMIIDYPNDIGCESAGDDDENDCMGETDPINTISAATTTFSTTGLTDDFDPDCISTTSGPDAVHVLQVPFPLTTLTVDTFGSSFDTTLYMTATTCAGTQLACNDQAGGTSQSEISISTVAAGNYMIFSDGWAGSSGNVTLNVKGEIAAGGECDPAKPWFACPAAHFCDDSGATPVCAPSQCADNMDNDMDGLTDMFDPGCDSPEDGTEAPDPSPLPECADGIDNDMDGVVDYINGDPGCTHAADNDETNCIDSDPLQSVDATPETGTTAGTTDDWTPSCQSNSSTGDVVYELTIPGNLNSLQVDTDGSAYDTVLTIKSGSCSGTEIECDDDDGAGLQSLISLGATSAGVYYIIIDGYSTNSGNYTLNISGEIASGQPCDPAQITAGLFTCEGATTCTDPGSGFVCQ